ncbi:DUF3850 domain-containing protein [Sporolactobacillus terrae]|uniref:ASCH domain-containing protein n=1 Tax=Sporolactobacillus terrae TaxID=269673 RepID=A0A5K7WY05_9BACL|nr:DUF3850 domain-containing protein [Sporolactobacillus terrae]BBN97478.1 hypothetical protein St703_01830 [Sporolactobacillus terrae]
MQTHDLKILPHFFQAVISGTKTFEIRKNDRNFQPCDLVRLHAWKDGEYLGLSLTKRIGFVTDYAQKDGYVVFSLLDVEGDSDD